MNVKVTWILLIATVLLVPTLWSQANPDTNGDGCVDLADYAAMQSTMTGPACIPGEARSFYAEGKESFELVDFAPGDQGFIVTDILAAERLAPPFTVRLIQDDGQNLETKMAVTMGSAGTTVHQGDSRSYHLETGVPFAAGSSIQVVTETENLVGLTVTGYTY